MGVPFDVVKDQHLSVTRREPVDRVLQVDPRRWPRIVGLGRRSLQRTGVKDQALRASHELPESIEQNTGEPDSERRPPLESTKPLDRPNPHVVHRVLGVSRTALREAIKGLVARGVLETRRKRGTQVLERERWNQLDADLIAWSRRDGSRRVSEELWSTLVETQPSLARLAAGRSIDFIR